MLSRDKGTFAKSSGSLYENNALSAKSGLKISRGLDLPVLLMSLFDRHDFVNPYCFGIDVVEQGIFSVTGWIRKCNSPWCIHEPPIHHYKMDMRYPLQRQENQ